jgi:hypothetical protein
MHAYSYTYLHTRTHAQARAERQRDEWSAREPSEWVGEATDTSPPRDERPASAHGKTTHGVRDDEHGAEDRRWRRTREIRGRDGPTKRGQSKRCRSEGRDVSREVHDDAEAWEERDRIKVMQWLESSRRSAGAVYATRACDSQHGDVHASQQAQSGYGHDVGGRYVDYPGRNQHGGYEYDGARELHARRELVGAQRRFDETYVDDGCAERNEHGVWAQRAGSYGQGGLTVMNTGHVYGMSHGHVHGASRKGGAWREKNKLTDSD